MITVLICITARQLTKPSSSVSRTPCLSVHTSTSRQPLQCPSAYPAPCFNQGGEAHRQACCLWSTACAIECCNSPTFIPSSIESGLSSTEVHQEGKGKSRLNQTLGSLHHTSPALQEIVHSKNQVLWRKRAPAQTRQDRGFPLTTATGRNTVHRQHAQTPSVRHLSSSQMSIANTRTQPHSIQKPQASAAGCCIPDGSGSDPQSAAKGGLPRKQAAM